MNIVTRSSLYGTSTTLETVLLWSSNVFVSVWGIFLLMSFEDLGNLRYATIGLWLCALAQALRIILCRATERRKKDLVLTCGMAVVTLCYYYHYAAFALSL